MLYLLASTEKDLLELELLIHKQCSKSRRTVDGVKKKKKGQCNNYSPLQKYCNGTLNFFFSWSVWSTPPHLPIPLLHLRHPFPPTSATSATSSLGLQSAAAATNFSLLYNISKKEFNYLVKTVGHRLGAVIASKGYYTTK